MRLLFILLLGSLCLLEVKHVIGAQLPPEIYDTTKIRPKESSKEPVVLVAEEEEAQDTSEHGVDSNGEALENKKIDKEDETLKFFSFGDDDLSNTTTTINPNVTTPANKNDTSSDSKVKEKDGDSSTTIMFFILIVIVLLLFACLLYNMCCGNKENAGGRVDMEASKENGPPLPQSLDQPNADNLIQQPNQPPQELPSQLQPSPIGSPNSAAHTVRSNMDTKSGTGSRASGATPSPVQVGTILTPTTSSTQTEISPSSQSSVPSAGSSTPSTPGREEGKPPIPPRVSVVRPISSPIRPAPPTPPQQDTLAQKVSSKTSLNAKKSTIKLTKSSKQPPPPPPPPHHQPGSKSKKSSRSRKSTKSTKSKASKGPRSPGVKPQPQLAARKG